jgi:hypothetical protein
MYSKRKPSSRRSWKQNLEPMSDTELSNPQRKEEFKAGMGIGRRLVHIMAHVTSLSTEHSVMGTYTSRLIINKNHHHQGGFR